jgi:hypothetical protein
MRCPTPPQVRARTPLVAGRDVVEVDTWGMDCYTRRNVFDAVLEADVFKELRPPQVRASLAVCVCVCVCVCVRALAPRCGGVAHATLRAGGGAVGAQRTW